MTLIKQILVGGSVNSIFPINCQTSVGDRMRVVKGKLIEKNAEYLVIQTDPHSTVKVKRTEENLKSLGYCK